MLAQLEEGNVGQGSIQSHRAPNPRFEPGMEQRGANLAPFFQAIRI